MVVSFLRSMFLENAENFLLFGSRECGIGRIPVFTQNLPLMIRWTLRDGSRGGTLKRMSHVAISNSSGSCLFELPPGADFFCTLKRSMFKSRPRGSNGWLWGKSIVSSFRRIPGYHSNWLFVSCGKKPWPQNHWCQIEVVLADRGWI